MVLLFLSQITLFLLQKSKKVSAYYALSCVVNAPTCGNHDKDALSPMYYKLTLKGLGNMTKPEPINDCTIRPPNTNTHDSQLRQRMFPSGDCRAGLCDVGYPELLLLLYVPCGTGYMLI